MKSHLNHRLALAAVILATTAVQSLRAQASEPSRDGGSASLTAFAAAPTVVVLQWQPAVAAVEYRVFRRTGITGGWCLVGGADGDATTYEDGSVSESSTYLYFVQALPEVPNSVAPLAIVTTPGIPAFEHGHREPREWGGPSRTIEPCDESGRNGGPTVHSGAQRLPSSAVLPAWLIEYENQIDRLFLTGETTAHPVMR